MGKIVSINDSAVKTLTVKRSTVKMDEDDKFKSDDGYWTWDLYDGNNRLCSSRTVEALCRVVHDRHYYNTYFKPRGIKRVIFEFEVGL